MNKKLWAIWAILSAGIFGIFEAVAILDGNPETTTLTYNVITYIPQPLFWIIIIPFFAWFIKHFKKYYSK